MMDDFGANRRGNGFLTPREREALQLRVDEPELTTADIGKRLGVSRARASELLTRAAIKQAMPVIPGTIRELPTLVVNALLDRNFPPTATATDVAQRLAELRDTPPRGFGRTSMAMLLDWLRLHGAIDSLTLPDDSIQPQSTFGRRRFCAYCGAPLNPEQERR